jgi:hypothetical protein
MVVQSLPTLSLPQRWVENRDGVQVFLADVAQCVADARRSVTAMSSFQGGFFVSDAAVGLTAEHVKGLGRGLVNVGSSPPGNRFIRVKVRPGFTLDVMSVLMKAPLEPRMRAPVTSSLIERPVGHWTLPGPC